jgi:glycosyltransferase involved in cell wall biosynthesis
VVVPAYNAEATLGACLASLLELTYPAAKIELLVVDNGSRDGTRAIIESFAPRVRPLAETKRGPAAARNRGIAEARGEIIAFTDADCVVDPDWLTQLIEPLSDPAAGIAGGAIRATQPCNQIEAFGEKIHDHEKAICVYEPPYVITMNWASPRAVLENTGGFDETLLRGEDVDLAWRILRAGKRFAYQPRAIIAHRNERTLRGLFREGIQHGYCSVLVNRKHEAFLEGCGHLRVNRASYEAALAALREYVRTRSMTALCDFTFRAGNKLGKLAGSARHGYLEL